MLLLTRQAGDVIAIGDTVVVRVLDVQGNRVQLGIEAPKDVKIRDTTPPPQREPSRK